MGKVKKPGEVTDVRRTKVSTPAGAPSGAAKRGSGRRTKSPPPAATKRTAKGSTGRKASGKPGAKSARKPTAKPPRKPAGKRAAAAPAGRPKSGARKATGGALERSARRTGGAGRGKASTKKAPVRATKPVRVPVVSYRIKPLDPFQKCGSGTSVQSLYRVDESVDGALKFHLVFFDRHGWYCEHGRNCPAVTHARKFDAGLARQHGPN